MKPPTKVTVKMIFQEFWRGILPYRRNFFLAYFLLALVPVINIFAPLLYKHFFDTLNAPLSKETAVSSLIGTITIVAILHLISWVLQRLGQYLYAATQIKIMARLKQNAFQHMIGHSYSFFANNFMGSLVQRVNRFVRGFEVITDTINGSFIPLAITVFGAIVITATVAPVISLVILGWATIFISFNVAFSFWRMKYNLRAAAMDSKTTGLLADDLSNQNAINSFNTHKKEFISFKNITEDQAAKTLLAWNLGNISQAFQMLLLYIVEFLAFYFGIIFWQQGSATVGTFVLVQIYIINLSGQFYSVGRFISVFYESIADSVEMTEIMALPHEIKDNGGAKKLENVKGKIEFKNVSFSFPEHANVLCDINVIIKPGEKVALVGPSGTGKTTFTGLLLRLYDVSNGAILIDNQDIRAITLDSLHQNISLVPQDPVLFHRSLLENIRYGKGDASDKEVLAAAKSAHCDEFIEKLPLKYETLVGERGIKLSGGERQRVAIARAILKNAPILVLDEATSSLDSQSEALIQDGLNLLMAKCTTIAIAHRLSTIRKMDRIIVMQNGNIAETGTHQSLIRKQKGTYKQLWKLQAGGFIK